MEVRLRQRYCFGCRDMYADIDEKGRCKNCGTKVAEPLKVEKKKK